MNEPNQPEAHRPFLVVAPLYLVIAAAASLCYFPGGRVWPAVGAIPLVLLLPGTLLVKAFDPWARSARGVQRTMWRVGSSIGISIAGGFLLNVTGGLYRNSWLIYYLSVSCVLGLIVLLRGSERLGGSPPVRDPDDDLVSDEGMPNRRSRMATIAGNEADGEMLSSAGENVESRREPNGSGSRVAWRALALLSLSAVVVAGALTLSERSQSTSLREAFVQLSIVPEGNATVNDAVQLQIGVRSYEHVTEFYEVRATGPGGGSVGHWTVKLKPGGEWTRRVVVAVGRSVSVVLVPASDRHRILESVHYSVAA